jgi:2-hydroxy-6-oxonona-2,4-dienedioate hydrolase
LVARAPVVGAWCEAAGHRLFTRLSSADAPPAMPLVLVHGWGVSSRYMVPALERLGGARRAYAPDLPGHGRSPRPRRALDVPALADLLLAWMDAMRLERAALLGNSMGCQVVVDLASRHPERVDRLVLIGPTLDDRPGASVRHLLRLLADIPFERPSLVPVVVWDYLRMGPRLLTQEVRHMFADAELEKMSRVDAPALVVRGEHDTVAPRAWAERVARTLPQAELREVPRWGHAVHFSAPDELATLVETFLESRSMHD